MTFVSIQLLAEPEMERIQLQLILVYGVFESQADGILFQFRDIRYAWI